MEQVTRRLRKAIPGRLSTPDIGPGVASIGHSDPRIFWGHLLAALEANRSCALFNPQWPEAWKDQLRRIAQDLSPDVSPVILVPTSGSSRLPKWCIHDLDTLTCSSIGYAQRFGAKGILHAVNVLPQHHVGGFMPVFRSAECGGSVHFADYRDPDTIKSAPFPLEQASLSVVPTQLYRMREDPEMLPILKSFGMILVGGAACPPDILRWAREEKIPLAPCYGSTETAAMVTAMDPDAFAGGANGVGTALPHARISVTADNSILVHSGSCLRQYHPESEGFSRDPWATGDLGELDEEGNLHILGRADRVIISGGEKVHPELVESAALATGLVRAARCGSVPDPDWGNRVELIVVPAGATPEASSFREALAERLPPYAVPKALYFTTEIPADELGKVRDSSI